jgi:hypothetical protein
MRRESLGKHRNCKEGFGSGGKVGEPSWINLNDSDDTGEKVIVRGLTNRGTERIVATVLRTHKRLAPETRPPRSKARGYLALLRFDLIDVYHL